MAHGGRQSRPMRFLERILTTNEMSHGGCCAPMRAGDTSNAESGAVRTRTTVHEIVARDLLALDGGTFRMGSDDPKGFPADGEGPVRAGDGEPVPDQPLRGDERAVRGVRRRDGVRDRGGAVRLVVRVPPAGAEAGRDGAGLLGRRAVVAGGGRRELEGAGRAGIDDRGPARPPGDSRLVERRDGVLCVERHQAANRGGVGARRARRTGPEAVRLG